MQETKGQRKTARGKAAKRFEVAERRRLVALLMRHLSQKEIAEALEVSEATVSDDVAALKARLQDEALVDVESMVREELASLDLDEASLRRELRDEESGKVRLYALDRVLAIQHRRAQLAGLDSVLRRKEKESEQESGTRDLNTLLRAALGESSQAPTGIGVKDISDGKDATGESRPDDFGKVDEVGSQTIVEV